MPFNLSKSEYDDNNSDSKDYDNAKLNYWKYAELLLRNPKVHGTQIPVGKINSLGTGKDQYNILLDSFLTYSGFHR